jgi:hypothetical protein
MSLRSVVATGLLLFLAAPAFATLNLPSNLIVEAEQPGGAIVDYSASVTGTAEDENGRPLVAATCSPQPKSLFALGSTTVTCTGSDGSQGSFTVKVVDSTGPHLNLPRDFTLFASNSSGAIVTYDASGSDVVSGSLAVTCSPASGSTFPIGTTRVTCSATDAASNTSSGGFDITVLAQSPPPPPPSEQTITAEATGPNGAVVTFSVAGDGPDDFNGRPAGACSAASGTLFPLGRTILNCSTVTLIIDVVDTTAPALSLPGKITQSATSANGATVTFNATANDLVDGSVAVSCIPSSGSTFPVGSSTVQCSATDAHSNTAGGSFVVEVTGSDTTAPDILSLTATPNTLSPPNNQLVGVTVTASVHDDADPTPLVRIYNVTANEQFPASDWEITGLLTVNLRASRNGNGSGRVYTIHVEAIDSAGNRSVSSVTVSVPHDQGSTSSVTTPPPPSKRRSVRG